MLYAGLDLSGKRLDFHLLDGEGATVEVGAWKSKTARLRRHGAGVGGRARTYAGARKPSSTAPSSLGASSGREVAGNRCGRDIRGPATPDRPGISQLLLRIADDDEHRTLDLLPRPPIGLIVSAVEPEARAKVAAHRGDRRVRKRPQVLRERLLVDRVRSLGP
jgi:hypothetical protein